MVGVNSVIRSVGGTETEAGNIGLAFAIPINQAKRVAQDIIDTGKARRTVIGAEVATGGATGSSGGRGAAALGRAGRSGGGGRAARPATSSPRSTGTCWRTAPT